MAGDSESGGEKRVPGRKREEPEPGSSPRDAQTLDECREQSEQNLVICNRVGWENDIGRLHSLLGHLVLPDVTQARGHLVQARAYAARTAHLEVGLRAHLLAAAIELQENHPDRAHAEASEGFSLADKHGFGLYAIDLLLALARSSLALSRPAEALTYAKEALQRATHPECGYAWGEADALPMLLSRRPPPSSNKPKKSKKET